MAANAAAEEKKQALLDMIDNGLKFRGSEMYDEQSIDDARSMVESLQGHDGGQDFELNAEEDEILKQTRALLANLKSEREQEEEASKDNAKV